MRRIFYVKGEQGEFIKVRIVPLSSDENANQMKFQISTDNFVAIIEKDKKGQFHFEPNEPQRLLRNIAVVIKRYYMDIVGS